MTNSISHVLDNDVLFIIGSNATEAHPIIGNKMKQAALQGSKLIVVDPRRTELAEYAHLWLQLKPGTDNALVNGILHTIISNGWQDEEYIAERTEGFDDVWATVKDYPAERASEICGVPAATIVEAARLYATTPKAGIYYTLGITEHTVGTANVMNLANLGMITGHIGFPYAGVNPMRGQNNVQGSCDMGALPNSYPGYASVLDIEAQKKFTELYGVQMPQDMGLRIPEMFELAVHGTLKAMFIMGEDPALTDADANHVRKALENLEFLAVQNIFMTETAKYADVFLPAALYAEKDGTFTNTERRVQRVRKAVEPPGDTRARLGDPPGPRQAHGHPVALRLAGGHLRGDPQGRAAVRRHDLRAARHDGPAVAVPHRGPPGLALPAQGPVHARQGAPAGHPVPGARGAHRRGVPDAPHHRPHALPLQHLHAHLAEPGVAAAARAGGGQPGGRGADGRRRGRRGARELAARESSRRGSRSPRRCRLGPPS